MNRFRLKLYELYARYHLKYTCPRCPAAKRARRDIFNQGDCFWYTNWKAKRYAVQTDQTYILFKKIGINKDLYL